MKRFLTLLLVFPTLLFAQKKTLDHSAYDEWRDFKSRMISNDGKYVAYSLANNNVGNEEAILKTTSLATQGSKPNRLQHSTGSVF